jgi:hypothetical protein
MTTLTHTEKTLSAAQGWVQVTAKPGYVTVNKPCNFAYSSSSPAIDFKGNYTALSTITNPTNSTLWLRNPFTQSTIQTLEYRVNDL